MSTSAGVGRHGIRTRGIGQHRRKALLRRLLLVSAAALIPMLAGCEAGNDAPTLQFHPPTDGAATTAADLKILNVFVLGAPLGSALGPGQNAGLFFAVVNTGSTADRLVSISAPGIATSVRLPAGGVPVGVSTTVLLTGPQPRAYLVKLTRSLTSGSDFTLTFNFLKQGPVTLQVPVFARATHYVTYSPAPTATPVTAAKHGHHGSATPTASGSPTPSSTPASTPSPGTS